MHFTLSSTQVERWNLAWGYLVLIRSRWRRWWRWWRGWRWSRCGREGPSYTWDSLASGSVWRLRQAALWLEQLLGGRRLSQASCAQTAVRGSLTVSSLQCSAVQSGEPARENTETQKIFGWYSTLHTPQSVGSL